MGNACEPLHGMTSLNMSSFNHASEVFLLLSHLLHKEILNHLDKLINACCVKGLKMEEQPELQVGGEPVLCIEGVALDSPNAGASCCRQVQIQTKGETSLTAKSHEPPIIKQRETDKNNSIIQVQTTTNELVKKMERRIQNAQRRPPGTIYRVPQIVLETGPDAYKPRVVSIGPYYHRYHNHRQQQEQLEEIDKLQDMEKHKWRYLHDFLHRKPNTSVADIIDSIRTLEERARNCYYEEVVMDSDNFIEIMVLDGCFLVELFLKQHLKSFRREDPLYSISWVLVRIAYDLLLLENQLPFFVIQHLFHHHADPSVSSLQTLAMNFFRHTVRMNREILEDHLADISNGEIHHLLHLFYRHARHPIISNNHTPLHRKPNLLERAINTLTRSNAKTDAKLPTTQEHLRPIRPFPNVVGLKEAGIKLRRGGGIGLLDISFKHGVLEIPHFYIEDSTNAFIRNLTALEQCHPELGNHFTIYTVFMNFIIDTAEDVRILRRKGIIEHTLGSDEKAAELFNWASNGTAIRNQDNYLTDVCCLVNRYCAKRLRIWRAKLMHDYFSSPWAALSVLAALVLLALTLLQSSFSLLEYCFPSENSGS